MNTVSITRLKKKTKKKLKYDSRILALISKHFKLDCICASGSSSSILTTCLQLFQKFFL